MAGSPASVFVVLVHGWNSHPGVWNRFIPHLDAAHIPYSRFSHVEMGHETLPHIAGALRDHIRKIRNETGYDGTGRLAVPCLRPPYSTQGCIAVL